MRRNVERRALSARSREERSNHERGAVGWLVVGIVVGVILVIWLLLKLVGGLF